MGKRGERGNFHCIWGKNYHFAFPQSTVKISPFSPFFILFPLIFAFLVNHQIFNPAVFFQTEKYTPLKNILFWGKYTTLKNILFWGKSTPFKNILFLGKYILLSKLVKDNRCFGHISWWMMFVKYSF